MSTRSTKHILKNSDIPNRPLPSSLLKGEPIVNTADGIMYFSGTTQSTSGWTAAGSGTSATFFEVGSNLYDLKLRNQITTYQGVSGAGLSGKFLSGTTTGFVLGDISNIRGVDVYVTGGTFSVGTGTATFTNNTGGTFSVFGFGSSTGVTPTIATYTYNSSNNTFTITDSTGATFNATIQAVSGLTVNGTISATTYLGLPRDVFVTGGTYAAGTTTFTNNTGGTFNVTGYVSGNTFVTGFTYTPSQNLLTILQNQGQPNLTASLNSFSGITLSNLTPGRVVYVGTNSLLTDEAGFTYDSATNVLSVPSDGTVNVGTGGLNVAGNAIIQGSLTVFGSSVSAFTNELYVEDPNIILNYNPTGSTTVTSIGAGFTIQDGNGISGGSVTLDIRAMNGFTGLTPTQIPVITEYTAATGYSNRAWVTQLNDIVIRSTNTTTPNGVRVLAEFDTLDGGSY